MKASGRFRLLKGPLLKDDQTLMIYKWVNKSISPEVWFPEVHNLELNAVYQPVGKTDRFKYSKSDTRQKMANLKSKTKIQVKNQKFWRLYKGKGILPFKCCSIELERWKLTNRTHLEWLPFTSWMIAVQMLSYRCWTMPIQMLNDARLNVEWLPFTCWTMLY